MPRDVLTGLAFEQGQHVCVFYDTPDEQVEVAALYVAEGLRKGERCLYAAATAADLDVFRQRLRALHIDPVPQEFSGALLLLTKEEAHLIDGCFDSERMLTMLNQAVEDALNDRFIGLRTCGDMSWLLDEAPGSSHVVAYEAMLNQFFRNVRALGMCQYDRRRLPAGLLDHAGLCAHSTVVIARTHKANPFFNPTFVSASGGDRSALDAKLNRIERI